MVGGAISRFEEQPLRADHRFREKVELRVERDGLRAFLLDIDFKMILQILAYTGAVCHYINSMLFQLHCRANARQHQKLW